jgi:hypothetical protein
MKNLPQRERVKRRVSGPCGRKCKTPFVYSASLRAWRKAVIEHNIAEADEIEAKRQAKLLRDAAEEMQRRVIATSPFAALARSA